MNKYLDSGGVARLWGKSVARLSGDAFPDEATAGRVGDLYTAASGEMFRCSNVDRKSVV